MMWRAEHPGIDRGIDGAVDGASSPEIRAVVPELYNLLYDFNFHGKETFMAVLDSLLAKKEDKSSVPSSPNIRKNKGGRPPTGKRGSGKAKKISKSARAGLLFPVTKFHRLLRKGRYARRISQSAAVYLSAVIEYLSAEMLELSGNACRDNKRQRLIPRHIVLAMKNDEELNQFCARVTCPGGGVLPFVHPALFAKGANSVPLRPVRRISTSLCEPGTT
uniref:Histone H2A n=3 Tax=Wuchereria bancrofti TaxID=6293 RepID=A0A1I8ETY9_WUCBA